MKIRIQTSIAGHADPRYDLPDFSFRPGEEVDVHDVLAGAWIDSGVAVAVKPAPRNATRTRSQSTQEGA